MGYEIVFFEYKDLDKLSFTKDDVVVGGIELMTRAYALLGVDYKGFPTYPQELQEELGRCIRKQTIGEVRNTILNEGAVFLKPLDDQRKSFTGYVAKEFRDLVRTCSLTSTHEVYVSPVFEFLTEYRCFIHKGELLGAKNYRGDFTKMIDFGPVRRAIEKTRHMAVAYCLDFGLTKHGSTLLVEANDSNAMGTYGLWPVYAANMIADRWHEVVNQ